MSKPLDGRVALVTGASRGIGYSVARELAKAGAHVVAVARTVGGLEELDDEVKAAGGSTTLVPLDVKDGEGIDRLGGAIFQRWGKLDILVGNAGILGTVTPVGHIAPKVFEEVMAVNVTANWRLLRSFDPLLRQSDNGRVIMMTSDEARSLPPFYGAYAASKAALNTLAITYAKETEHTNVKTVLVDPGAIRTQLRAKARPGEDRTSLTTPDEFAPVLTDLIAQPLDKSGVIWNFETKSFQDIQS